MAKAWNAEKRFFAQSYEDKGILDSALLIMPLVFFSTPVRRYSVFLPLEGLERLISTGNGRCSRTRGS